MKSVEIKLQPNRTSVQEPASGVHFVDRRSNRVTRLLVGADRVHRMPDGQQYLVGDHTPQAGGADEAEETSRP